LDAKSTHSAMALQAFWEKEDVYLEEIVAVFKNLSQK
jgi:hypothetical protein